MLYITPTPIGNLSDVTDRMKTVFASADFIIAENPGYTKRLLNHLEIEKPIIQFAEHNELKVLDKIVARLAEENACLVTDAGTPGISDPGFRLVRACVTIGIPVTALPGANAAVTALSASGLPTDKFLFVGFFPKTELKVLQMVKEAKDIEATLIAYESPQRILKSLTWIAASEPDCSVVVARELTKVHEEYVRGTATHVLEIFKERQSIKGEITILIGFK